MDYSKVGLKCGLEIHQQLEGKKLFCSCPTLLRDDPSHFTILRKLRASAGESGEIDVAAAQEQARGKTFLYEGYHDSTCLVELDEEPPQIINQEALRTALQFSLLTQAEISPIIQVMRKIVVDGSNTSGFQRTALIARSGTLETNTGTVKISNITLEEDSAKIIAESSTEKRYRIDRLGIPLIEIGTEPDIHTPEQAQETAKKMGLLLRSLPGIKRGLGTIRQDVNVSVKGGARIEIKGAQDLRMLAVLVELEAQRQLHLLQIKEELKNKKINTFQIIDVTSILQASTSKIISTTIKNKGVVSAIKLNHLAGILGNELQPGFRVGTELAGYAKIKAGVAGIFHSDELPAYGITREEVTAICKKLSCVKTDAFVLVVEQAEIAQRALQAVYDRAQQLFLGVPQEVRKAHENGTTSFMRPIPGAARMYPETDIPLIEPDLSAIRLPEILEQKIQRYQTALGLSKDLAVYMAKSEKMLLFEGLVKTYPKIKPAFIAETLTSTLLEIKRKYSMNIEILTDSDFFVLFQYLMEDKIHKDIILDVLIEMCKKTFDITKYQILGTEEIHRVLHVIVAKNRTAPFSALMGLAMKELNGKASGKFIADALQQILKKGHT